MNLIQLKKSTLEIELIDGPQGAPRSPLVFLHEGLGSVAMWRSRDGFWPAQVCAATGRAGVVYSRRGYGQSSAIADVRGANRLPPDYMHQEAWQVLPELLNALGIERPVLLGHSDGTGAHLPSAMGLIGTPVHMVKGVRCKGMTFGAACTPPRRPVLAQRAIALLGGLVGGKEGNFDVLAIEHLGNQGRHAHVAGVKGQVQRFVARRCMRHNCEAGQRNKD